MSKLGTLSSLHFIRMPSYFFSRLAAQQRVRSNPVSPGERTNHAIRL